MLKKSAIPASPSSSPRPAPSTSTASEAGVPSGATPPSTGLSVESSCTDETRRLSPSCSTCTCSPAASFVPATSILRQRTSSSTQTSTRGRRLLLLLIVEVSYFLVLDFSCIYSILTFLLPCTCLQKSSSLLQNPWWRTPTHPARWCCSMPTR